MIDLSFNYNAPKDEPAGCCECGDPQCDGDAKWLAQATADIAMQLADSVPGLDSPLLKLVRERNEARRLCMLLADALVDIPSLTTKKAIEEASLAQHSAVMALVKSKKHWDARSYQQEGAQ